MQRRDFCVEVERTVTYRRKVWVQVEETDERLKDAKRYPGDLFKDEAGDTAVEKARSLAGWEQTDVAYDGGSVAEVQGRPVAFCCYFLPPRAESTTNSHNVLRKIPKMRYLHTMLRVSALA